jgi:nicotinate-nucleotide pyrophosphorylase (carboxylating)
MHFMQNGAIFDLDADRYIRAALEEDMPSGDISTDCVVHGPAPASVQLIAKQDCVLCGIGVFSRTFELIDGETCFSGTCADGDRVKKGDVLGTVDGDVRTLLSGERTALNYLQRMSGVATMTAEYVKALEPFAAKLLDTRKTTPCMRIFQKYAVRVGGGYNHRYCLSDGIMLKDNHISAAGGVREAVEAVREHASFVHKIEVETEDLDMVREALEAGADIIMLDNMSCEEMAEAVKIIDGRALTECSGDVTLERLPEIGRTGVDYVSCGALTHSAPVVDFSMKNLRML